MQATAGVNREDRRALEADMVYLSERERQVFDSLPVGVWVPRQRLCRQLYRAIGKSERQALRVILARLGGKLRSHGAPWRIEGAIGIVRLMPTRGELAEHARRNDETARRLREHATRPRA